jgi:hypothetical protein
VSLLQNCRYCEKPVNFNDWLDASASGELARDDCQPGLVCATTIFAWKKNDKSDEE